MKRYLNEFLPLSAAELHILLALRSADRHGCGIRQKVAREPDNRYRLGPGTLYDNLQKLLAEGIVEEPSPRGGSFGHNCGDG
jgi:DNA-binding PadR family transcriptional regulator